MSFSFTAAGTPKDIVAEVGRQAANTESFPQNFADAVNDQLARLPEDVETTLSCYGHTERNPGQLQGNILLHAQIDWRTHTLAPPIEEIVDTDPEVQPGPERFPEGYTGDAPAGPGAADEADA